MRTLIRGAAGDFRHSWKQLVLTDILFKIITFVLLTPLLGALFRLLIATSGNAVLSDVDILFFFLGPAGWVCLIVVGALWLGIIALEQATLLGVLGAKRQGLDFGPVAALRFACAHAGPVIRVTMRVVLWTALAITPFLAVAAAVYFTLLTEYDINYYLKEKPPVFGVAVGIGVIIVAALVIVLLRLFTGWFFALPLVLFEGVSPRAALRQSAARSHGHRRTLLLWVVGWALAMTLISALAAGLVGYFGQLFVPESTELLRLLAFTVGMTMLLGAVVSFVVNMLNSTTFATILFHLYQELGQDGGAGNSRAEFAAVAANDSRSWVTRKRLLAAGIVGTVVAFSVGAGALQTVRLDDDVQIMAHRGSSKAAPENTLAAFQKAIGDGADWIELDVQETADGVVVVLHDSDFMKLAGQNLKIWNAKLDDLKDLDIGSWFSPEFKDARVPTLAEVLAQCKGKIRVNIELKYYGHEQQLEQRVADLVEAHGMAAEVVAMSLKIDGVRKMKSIRPDWKVGLLMSVSAGNLRKIEADFLAVNARFVTPRLIRSAHDNGKEIYVWTVNDAPTMSSMISLGVDGLLTDKPALARSVLQQRAQMSAPERLLLELGRMLGTASDIGEQ